MPVHGALARKAKITGRTLHLYGPFDADLAVKVFEIPEAERLAIRTLDLTDIDCLFADGALPVVADFARHGKHLRIRCEGKPQVAKSLEFHGWANLIQSGASSEDGAVPQRVRQFATADRIDAFVTQSVRNVMQRVRCAQDVLKSFEWSLSEVIGNVFTHSESPIGALTQTLIMPRSNSVRFSVVDAGVGLRETLARRYKDVKDDPSAIRLAIQKGITRDTEAGQGWGLYGTSKIASASGGFLSIWTGNGRMVIHANGHADFHSVPFFHGTIVDFSLSTTAPLSLQSAIDAVYVILSLSKD